MAIIRLAHEDAAQFHAVDCTKNFKVELLVRVYDIGSQTRCREIMIDDLNSGFALDAEMACHKWRGESATAKTKRPVRISPHRPRR